MLLALAVRNLFRRKKEGKLSEFVLQVTNARRFGNEASCILQDHCVTLMQLLLMMVKEVPLGEEAVL